MLLRLHVRHLHVRRRRHRHGRREGVAAGAAGPGWRGQREHRRPRRPHRHAARAAGERLRVRGRRRRRRLAVHPVEHQHAEAAAELGALVGERARGLDQRRLPVRRRGVERVGRRRRPGRVTVEQGERQLPPVLFAGHGVPLQVQEVGVAVGDERWRLRLSRHRLPGVLLLLRRSNRLLRRRKGLGGAHVVLYNGGRLSPGWLRRLRRGGAPVPDELVHELQLLLRDELHLRDVGLAAHVRVLAPRVERLELVELLGEAAEDGVHALAVVGLHLRELLDERRHHLRELAVELHALLHQRVQRHRHHPVRLRRACDGRTRASSMSVHAPAMAMRTQGGFAHRRGGRR
ncbi:Os05g0426150 [Oryza sativa Japonica Group]|uniref:Os05g0426150 protein n=1 Tax=Oryza sativa subsp. japonica TaxID=39947 RepID=A0A0P0WMM1_ORYSJ|nr:hypothetical protein EE612_029622 [Oryza sativa]BAS94114.1 Os05g0426150 [Oryza sativa Japonica Group]